MSKNSTASTKRQRRRENLLAGRLTPTWAKVDGPPMRMFRRQMRRAGKVV